VRTVHSDATPPASASEIAFVIRIVVMDTIMERRVKSGVWKGSELGKNGRAGQALTGPSGNSGHLMRASPERGTPPSSDNEGAAHGRTGRHRPDRPNRSDDRARE
jgi:hypothetical protein